MSRNTAVVLVLAFVLCAVRARFFSRQEEVLLRYGSQREPFFVLF